MQPRNLTETTPSLRVNLTPLLADEFIEEEEEGIDPYQEFFNHLTAQGATATEAWDMIWENPGRANMIGTALAGM